MEKRANAPGSNPKLVQALRVGRDSGPDVVTEQRFALLRQAILEPPDLRVCGASRDRDERLPTHHRPEQ